MNEPAAPHVERTEFESRDADEVRSLLVRRYIEHRPRILGDPRGYRFRSRSATAGDLTVDHVTWRASMALDTAPFESMLVITILDGRFDLRAGGVHHRARRGDVVLYPPGTPLDLLVDRMVYHVTQFPLPARLAERHGIAPGELRFDGAAPLSAAMARHWQATAQYLTRCCTGPEPAAAHPLLLAGALEAAGAAALAAFPNTTMTGDRTRGPGRVAPAAVRRAVAYIDAHAGRPITVDDVAAAAGVSVRGLQAAFLRHRDSTPTGYLRRVRLEGAHRDLQSADPGRGDTVAEIARRWGFAAPGRFATAYRSRFGHSPSRTLRA